MFNKVFIKIAHLSNMLSNWLFTDKKFVTLHILRAYELLVQLPRSSRTDSFRGIMLNGQDIRYQQEFGGFIYQKPSFSIIAV